MNVITYIMAGFAVIGAVDRIFGNKLGLGTEFEKGIQLLGAMMLSMVGMLILVPLFTTLLQPLVEQMNGFIDPSFIPSLLFANDMGGASMAISVANNPLIGKFNALVVSSMMGVTFSFTLPYALGVVKKDKHKPMFLGFLCGIVTIPFGCFLSGIIMGIGVLDLIVNLLPLIIICVVIVIGLIKAPSICIKIFSAFGVFIKILVTIGLAIGIFQTLTEIEILPYVATVSEAGQIIISIACVLAGAFPFINLLSKILRKPIGAIGNKIGIGFEPAIGILSTLASSATAFSMMNDMDDVGVTVNAAFTISGAFLIGSHMAFTIAFSPDCLLPVLLGKLVAGILAIVVAMFVAKKVTTKKSLISNQIEG